MTRQASLLGRLFSHEFSVQQVVLVDCIREELEVPLGDGFFGSAGDGVVVLEDAKGVHHSSLARQYLPDDLVGGPRLEHFLSIELRRRMEVGRCLSALLLGI